MSFSIPIDTILGIRNLPRGAGGGVTLGPSRQGREVVGYRFGEGPLRLSLIAGCHADEPVGPAMLERLCAWLGSLGPEAPELRRATWMVVPRVNPDGDAANASWSALPPLGEGYDLGACLDGAVRELPGDDVEFGFPRGETDAGARPENLAVAAFLRQGGPYHLHITFHGMAFAAGPWFLLESFWVERTGAMRHALNERVRALGYRLHDVDRGGEKGFWRIGEGFTTRPDSRSMRDYFLARGETETAALFRPSSMEWVQSLGGDPLTLVSEMPLFLYEPDEGAPAPGSAADPPLPTAPGPARRFVAWARQTQARQGPEALAREGARLGLSPMPVGDQMRLQLGLLEEGIRAAAAFAVP